jgi:hypothetical protein
MNRQGQFGRNPEILDATGFSGDGSLLTFGQQVITARSDTPPDPPNDLSIVWVDSSTDELKMKITDGAGITREYVIAPSALNDRNSGLIDAFGRVRISQPYTIFDSKQLHDNLPLFYDESITNGSGNATSTHSTSDASTTMHVENGDTIIRQTFQHFNYQPGKSQLYFFTGRIEESGGATGVKARIGCFTGTDGLFFELDATTMYVVERKASSDTRVAQSSWNIDKMDGTGTSGITADWSKTNIFFVDFEWLGVGTVRYGLAVNGKLYYVHETHHANSFTSVYMSTPNLPVRYEISSTSGNGNMEHICSSVITEGGREENGVLIDASTGSTLISAATAGTIYGLMAGRLKSTHLDATVAMKSLSALETAGKDCEFFVAINPTLAAGSWSFSGYTGSSVEIAIGNGTQTITANSWGLRFSGVWVAGGGGSAGNSQVFEVPSALGLGSKIDGTAAIFVVCARPVQANANVGAIVQWRELL